MKDGITEDYLTTLLTIIPKIKSGIKQIKYTKLAKDLTDDELKVLGLTKKMISKISLKPFTLIKTEPIYYNHLPVIRKIAKTEGMAGLEKYVASAKSKSNIQKFK